jgi:hypothetical protein
MDSGKQVKYNKARPLKDASRGILKSKGIDTPANITWFQLILIILGVVVLTGIGAWYVGFTSRLGESSAEYVFSQSQKGQVAGDSTTTPSILPANGSPCYYEVCESFLNLDNWTNWGKFENISNQPLTLRAPINNGLAGWVMQSKFSVPLGFVMNFNFIPQGTQSNMLIRYGDVFDLNVGDGGYSRISVISYGNYVRPNGYKNRNYTLPMPIQKNTEVKLRLEVAVIPGTNKISLNPTVTYYTADGSSRTEIVPTFIVNSENDPNSLNEQIGLGLTDPTKYGDIQAVFESLIIDKQL